MVSPELTISVFRSGEIGVIRIQKRQKQTFCFCQIPDTAERIAEENKISHDTVKRAEKYVDAIDTISNNVDNEIKQKAEKFEGRVMNHHIFYLLNPGSPYITRHEA